MSAITIGTFQLQTAQLPGTTATLRVYYQGPTTNFITSEGVIVECGNVGSNVGFYVSVNCTIAGNILTVPSFVLESTDDSDQPTVTATAILFDQNGARRDTIFNNWIITATLGSPITYAQLYTFNLAVVLPNPPASYLSSSQVSALITQAIGTLNDASDTVKGRTRLSVAPTLMTAPIAYGINDTHQPLTTSPVYWASQFASFNAAVTAIGSAQATLIISAQMTATNVTVPATLTLWFIGAGSLSVTTGNTVTIVGPIVAAPIQIFVNALSGQGTISFSGNKVLREVPPEWWGALGDNLTINTTQITAAIIALQTALGGKLKFGGGIYLTGPLTYTGASATGAIIIEGVGNSRSATSSTIIRYTGGAGSALLTLLAANNSTIRDISFDGNSLALKGVYVDFGPGNAGSSGVTLQNVFITGVTGAGSKGIQLGSTNIQTSEVYLYNVQVQGTSTDYGLWTSNANVKNFFIFGGRFSGCGVAGIQYGGSGTMMILGTVFNANTTTDVGAPGNGSLTIQDFESEGSGALLVTSGASANPSTFRLENGSWTGTTNTNDVVVNAQGNVMIKGCQFLNQRTGGSLPKIVATGGASTTPAILVSEGNWYANTSGHAPFYDGVGGNDIYTTYTTTNTNLWQIRSFGDYGGASGGNKSHLANWQMGGMDFSLGGSTVTAYLLSQSIGATLSVTANAITPTSNIHHCGAGLIKTITMPTGFTGTLTLIPDSAFTYDNTGNIVVPAGGGTATINRAMTFTLDGTKWVPSY